MQRRPGTARGIRPTQPRTVRTVRRRRFGGGGGDGGSWAKYLLGLVLVIPLGIGLRMCGKSRDDGGVRHEMHAMIRTIPDYAQHAAYYDRLVDDNHGAAFEQAYRLGGRHQSNHLDAKRYFVEILRRMSAQAGRDGRAEMQATLAVYAARAQALPDR